MQEITLQALLEAGCHFGHKAERWHPKAAEFIYTQKDGIHIIDLAKTKFGLEAAMTFVQNLVKDGSDLLFVATKRQAKGAVKESVQLIAPYLVERWIGGFLTNWDQVQKNISKINRMLEEDKAGVWKKFPKHEQLRLQKDLERLQYFYGGVLKLKAPPTALFVVDVKKEIAAVREAWRLGIPVVAIVDTNTNPEGIDYPIPANDDAVGSIVYITQAIAHAYQSGMSMRQKNEPDKTAISEVKDDDLQVAKKRGRPKKSSKN